MNVSDDIGRETVPVAAIGAARGSGVVLKRLLSALPKGTGLAFVVLSPDALPISEIADLSSLPVDRLEHDRPVEPDTVLILPWSQRITLTGACIGVSDQHPADGVGDPHPIDRLLCHLAEARGPSAIGVVLSDTGADGAIGLQQIKVHGGITVIEQGETTGGDDEMPKHADFVLRAEDIAPAVVKASNRLKGIADNVGADRLSREIEARLDDILTTVSGDRREAFQSYKTGTLVRRIARRMGLHGNTEVPEYLVHLDGSTAERTVLRSDLLIGFTQFFRDPGAFEAFGKKVLRPLFDREQESFRIWVPGCSTGEEVYSIAMLAHEMAEASGDHRPWRIFGTDIEAGALARARTGVYAEAALAGLTRARIDRHFTRQVDDLALSESVRQMCVFAPHTLLQDPPFSRLDAISCRNVLIYLNDDAQTELLKQFHYGLKPGGFLWLGASEATRTSAHLFDAVDDRARLFARNDTAEAGYANQSFALPERTSVTTWPQREKSETRALEAEVKTTLLARLQPPFLAVGPGGDILYLSEGMTRLTRPAHGHTGTSIETLLPDALHEPVHLADARARATPGAVARISEVAINTEVFDISAVAASGQAGMVVMTFQPAGTPLPPAAGSEREEQQLASLEQQYETLARELMLANRDLVTTNRDLQTSNEELEAGREELQSLNEELEAVNAELSRNNKEIVEAHEDLANLFDATSIATLFLDDEHCVRRFTPALQRLFRIREADARRPIQDVATALDYPELEKDATIVHRTDKPVVREVSTRDGGMTFSAELRPYRTQNSGTSGVVVSFIDITDRKDSADQLARAADRMAQQYGELEALYNALPLGLCLIDRDHRWIRINDTLAEINGLSAEESKGEDARQQMQDIQAQIAPIVDQIFETEEPVWGQRITGETPAQPGVTRDWVVDFFPVRGNDGVFAVGSSVREITHEVQLERQLENAEARMRRIFNRIPACISMHLGARHQCIYLNSRYTETLRSQTPPGDEFLDAWGTAREPVAGAMDEAFGTGETVTLTDVQMINPDGSDQVFTVSVVPWYNEVDRIAGVLTFAIDTSNEAAARRQAEEERLRLGRLRDSLGVFIALLDVEGKLIEVNATVIDRSAVSLEDVIGRPFWECYWWSFDDAAAARCKDAFERALKGEIVRYDSDVRMHEDDIIRIDFQMVPVFDADGKVIEVVPSGIDVSARVAAEERKDILLAELEHRVKNTLATVQAVARITSRSTSSKDDFTDALISRLGAISRTHDALTGQDWAGEYLSVLIRSETAGYGDTGTDRITVEGDDVLLSPSHAMSMGLALHELVTNAAKYGALAVDTGHLNVRVKATDGVLSYLEWRETGVVVDTVEQKQGFGTYLLRNVLTRELDMDISMEFTPDGLVCCIGNLPQKT